MCTTCALLTGKSDSLWSLCIVTSGALGVTTGIGGLGLTGVEVGGGVSCKDLVAGY